MTAEEKRKHRLAHPKTHPEENNRKNSYSFLNWLQRHKAFNSHEALVVEAKILMNLKSESCNTNTQS